MTDRLASVEISHSQAPSIQLCNK